YRVTSDGIEIVTLKHYRQRLPRSEIPSRLTEHTFERGNTMHIRRCATLLIEPRETIGFDLGALLGGETGVRTTLGWVALAGHVDDEIPLDAAEVALLGELSPNAWIPFKDLAKKHPREALEALLAKGLAVAQDSDDANLRDHARRDEALRATHWRDLAAVMHRHTRWKDVDTEDA